MESNYILCIETSTEVCSVALSKSGVCIAEKSINEPNAHGTLLTVQIESILHENELSIPNLSAVAYSNGPGSYTGLRIGLSVAKGICYGGNIPLIAVSTLQHMVYMPIVKVLSAPLKTKNFKADETEKAQSRRSSRDEHFEVEAQRRNSKFLEAPMFYFPMIDARRMEVYGALLDNENNFILEPFSCIINEYDWAGLLTDKKVCFLGNGVAKSKELLKKFPNACFIDDYTISATSLCFLAAEKFDHKEFANLAYHVPFYLKEANVTASKKRAL